MATNIITGKSGAVDGIGCIESWSVSHSADLAALVASCSDGMTITLEGNKDWTGEYTASGPIPVKNPGSTFTFTGSVDGSKGCYGSAVALGWTVNWDVEGSGEINHTVRFAAQGALTIGAAVVADATSPDPHPSKGCILKLGTMATPIVYTELGDLRTAELTVQRDDKSGASSSTAGYKYHDAGNWSGTFRATVYLKDYGTLPVLDAYNALQVFVDTTKYWLVKWVQWSNVGPIGANVRDAALVEATIEGQISGWGLISTTWTKGAITDPDAADVWS